MLSHTARNPYMVLYTKHIPRPKEPHIHIKPLHFHMVFIAMHPLWDRCSSTYNPNVTFHLILSLYLTDTHIIPHAWKWCQDSAYSKTQKCESKWILVVISAFGINMNNLLHWREIKTLHSAFLELFPFTKPPDQLLYIGMRMALGLCTREYIWLSPIPHDIACFTFLQ